MTVELEINPHVEVGFQSANRMVIKTAYCDNHSILLKWLTRILGDRDAAHDIAQAAFVNVWSYCDQNPIDSPKAFIFRTAANLAFNELRRRNRFLERSVFPHDPVDVGPMREQKSEDASPEKTIELKQQTERILEAIDLLPYKPRTAFKLHRFKGLNYREIAEKMRVSESSVEKYMIEALRQLREALDSIS